MNIPTHIHELIAASRARFGRRFFSDSVDAMLLQIETYISSEETNKSDMECLLREQELLLPGFRHLVIYPGRNGGRPAEICTRLCTRFYLYCFGNHSDLNFWVNGPSSSSCHYSPLVYSELMAFAEIFPEALERRHFDGNDKNENEENYKWFCNSQSFLPRLEEMGLERWAANDNDKESYYRSYELVK